MERQLHRPKTLDESTYGLMLYFPDLSDSGRMAIVEFPFPEGASNQNTAPPPVDEEVHPGIHPGGELARGTDASDQPGSGSSASEQMGGW